MTGVQITITSEFLQILAITGLFCLFIAVVTGFVVCLMALSRQIRLWRRKS